MIYRRLPKLVLALLASCTTTVFAYNAYALESLPYDERIKTYSGYPTTIFGDLESVAMAGATAGLADGLMGSFENPAALSHTLDGARLIFSRNSTGDQHIQSFDEKLVAYTSGLAISNYPWGFGIGIGDVGLENQNYEFTKLSRSAHLEVKNFEYRFAVSRYFESIKTSFGLSLNYGLAEENFVFLDESNPIELNREHQFGLTVGAQSQIADHLMAGLAATTPMVYSFSPGDRPDEALSDFYQTILVPLRISTGLGWMPNHHFKTDFSFHIIGKTKNTALLSDQGIEVGNRLNIQPRLGVSYRFLDFRSIAVSLFSGSYFESTRIEGKTNRIHFTGGFKGEFWVVNFGFGLDESANYRNIIATIGLDPIEVGQFLNLIPKEKKQQPKGFLPNPFEIDDAELPRALVKNWKERERIDPIKTGLSIPNKIKSKFENATKGGIEGVGKSLIDAVKSAPESIQEEFEEDLDNKKP